MRNYDTREFPGSVGASSCPRDCEAADSVGKAASRLTDMARFEPTVQLARVWPFRLPEQSFILGVSQKGSQLSQSDLLPGHIEDRVHCDKRYAHAPCGSSALDGSVRDVLGGSARRLCGAKNCDLRVMGPAAQQIRVREPVVTS
jgi:hypothetical protein